MREPEEHPALDALGPQRVEIGHRGARVLAPLGQRVEEPVGPVADGVVGLGQFDVAQTFGDLDLASIDLAGHALADLGEVVDEVAHLGRSVWSLRGVLRCRASSPQVTSVRREWTFVCPGQC